MKVGSMNLDNLPLGGGGSSPPSNDALAHIGNKLVEALTDNVEWFRTGGQPGGHGSNSAGSLKEMLEMMKFLRELQGDSHPQNARDVGLAEMLKVLVETQRENTKLMLETMRKDPPSESEADKFMKELAFNMIQGNLQNDPHEAFKRDVNRLAELKEVLSGLNPPQQGLSVSDQLKLLDIQGQREFKKLELDLQRHQAERELSIKEKELEVDDHRISDALSVAGDFFSRRRGDEQQTPRTRTAESAAAPASPVIGLQRVKCDACSQETLMRNGEQFQFCPHCGDPKQSPNVPDAPQDLSPEAQKMVEWEEAQAQGEDEA